MMAVGRYEMTETIPGPASRNETIVNRFFPQSIDNRYSGSKIALWLFGLIVFVHILQSVNLIMFGLTIVGLALSLWRRRSR